MWRESLGDGGLIQTVRRWFGRPSGESALEPDGGVEASAPDEGGETEPFTGFSEESIPKVKLLQELGLTPEQYIVSGLDMNGGRLRQQEIVARTGWSEASVSRTLTQMEADGSIVRIQIGREKVVCLPGACPNRFETSDATSRDSADGRPTADEQSGGATS